MQELQWVAEFPDKRPEQRKKKRATLLENELWRSSCSKFNSKSVKMEPLPKMQISFLLNKPEEPQTKLVFHIE